MQAWNAEALAKICTLVKVDIACGVAVKRVLQWQLLGHVCGADDRFSRRAVSYSCCTAEQRATEQENERA